jgi:hypothetical protein
MILMLARGLLITKRTYGVNQVLDEVKLVNL